MLTLPQPDRRPLANAALPQVVTQIRFNEDTIAVPAEELAAVQGALAVAGMPHPRLSQVTANEVIVVQGPGQMTAETPQRRGWRLDTTDGDWQLTLMPGSVALETPRFPGFGVLAERIAVVLGGVGEVAQPAVVTRVGLRFVNLLPSLSADAGLRGWPSWVAPELTGLLAHTELGDGVAGTEQRTIVTINEQMSATVHAGLVAQPEGHRFLLDIDSYSEPAASWSIELVSGLLADLNDASVSLFQMLLSPEMLSYLRGDVVTGEGDR